MLLDVAYSFYHFFPPAVILHQETAEERSNTSTFSFTKRKSKKLKLRIKLFKFRKKSCGAWSNDVWKNFSA